MSWVVCSRKAKWRATGKSVPAECTGHCSYFSTPAHPVCLSTWSEHAWLSIVRSTLISSTTADEDRGTLSCGRPRCNTCLHTNTSTFIDTLQVNAILLHRNTPLSVRMWFMLSNATHVIRWSISEKLVDAWVTDLGNLYAPQGYQNVKISWGDIFDELVGWMVC